MKIYCNRTELNKALNNVSHSVPVRTTSSILEGILVNVEEGKMFLTATDTNMTTETVINVNSEGICEFVVPAKLFSAIISKLPEDEMMIDYDEAKSKINIKCAGSNSEIICFRGDEYPKIRLNEGNNVIYVSKEDIKKNWGIDRKFEPQMDAEKRKKSVAGWKKAVKTAIFWAEN